MRYLLTALLLLPVLLSAQEFHTFRNGEVTDAEQINENFQMLSKTLHPTGYLHFNYDDEVVWTDLGGEDYRFVNETLKFLDGTTVTIRKRRYEGLWV